MNDSDPPRVRHSEEDHTTGCSERCIPDHVYDAVLRELQETLGHASISLSHTSPRVTLGRMHPTTKLWHHGHGETFNEALNMLDANEKR